MVEKTFSFGKNWNNYLKSLNDERIRNAELSLKEFLNLNDLRGKRFLDIGCGSGLFSFAAYNLGATDIVSLDVDPFSVECCKYLHKKANSPNNWKIYSGSVLDTNFISKFEGFDIIYSWGVLHHTGNMWEAIKNSSRLVSKGGCYYIAIYNNVEGRKGSLFWLKIKKLYNASSSNGKRIMEWLFILNYFISHITRFRNPLKNIINYKSKRGMNWRTDITDWIGGYPYEFAKVEEIIKFMRDNYPDFILENLKTDSSIGCNEFLFKRNRT